MSIENVRDPWAKETLQSAQQKIEGRDLGGAAEDLKWLVDEMESRGLGVFYPRGMHRGNLFGQLPQTGNEPADPPSTYELREDATRVPEYLEALARENADLRTLTRRALLVALAGPEGAIQYYGLSSQVKKTFNPRVGRYSFKANTEHLTAQNIGKAFTFATNIVMAIEAGGVGPNGLKPVVEREYPKD